MTKLKEEDIKERMKFAFTIVGLVATIIGLLFGALSYFQKQKPELVYETLSFGNVLDIREEISDLQVLFRTKDIKQSKQDLKLLLLKVSNKGTEPILQSYFDSSLPWGIGLPGGVVVSSSIQSSSSEYVRNNLTVENVDSAVYFKKIIMEPADYFIVKMIVLVPTQKTLKPFPLGKIAGQNIIPLVDIPEDAGRPSIWSQAFVGTLGTVLLRTFVYMVGTIALAIGIIWLLVTLDERKRSQLKDNRRQFVVEFKDGSRFPVSKEQESFLGLFVQSGLHAVEDMLSAFSNFEPSTTTTKKPSELSFPRFRWPLSVTNENYEFLVAFCDALDSPHRYDEFKNSAAKAELIKRFGE